MRKHLKLYLDTETTGLDPMVNSIIQLACILEIDGTIVDTFNDKCCPVDLHKISPRALEVTQTSYEELQSRPSHKDMFKKFLGFINKHFSLKEKNKFTIYAQNSEFDIKFLKAFFIHNKYPTKSFHLIFEYQYVDLLGLNTFFKGLNYIPEDMRLRLEKVCDYYQVPILNAHDAMADIQATYDVIQRIKELFIKKPDEIRFLEDEDSPIRKHIESLV